MEITIHLVAALVTGFFGILAGRSGLKKRKEYRAITETPTTDIRNVTSEGTVEFTGTIDEPVDGRGFVSPISQTADTVFAVWYVYEWKKGSESSVKWGQIDGGMYSVPFYLDDGTARIQVAIGNHPSDVTWNFGGAHTAEVVRVDSEPSVDIPTFVDKHELDEQQRSDFPLDNVDRDHLPERDFDTNTYGDRCYAEWTFGPGDEMYLLGQAHAAQGMTTQLRPANAIVTPADEPFIISEKSEDELTREVGADADVSLAGSAIFFILCAVFLIAWLTPLL